MTQQINPLSNYVAAQELEADQQASSGIYLPKSAQERPQMLKVIAVGPHVTQVKVGDKIVFRSYTQTEIKVEGVTYALIKEEDIIGLVE